MRGLRTLILCDLKLYLREPAATFFTLIFPALILVIGGYSFGQAEALTTEGGVTLRIVDLMLPGTLAWVIASQGLLGTYPVLTSLREAQVLKYYRTHPIRTIHVLLSQFTVGLLMLLFSLGLLWFTGNLLFHLRADAHLGAFFLALLLTYSAFFTLGFALASVTPTPRLAQAAGSVLFFPLLFVSGTFGPRTGLPPALKLLSDLSPLSHANDTLTTLWVTRSIPLTKVLRTPLPYFGVTLGKHTLFQGITPWHSLLYLGALTVLAALLAVRTFRWGVESGKTSQHPPVPGQSPTEDQVIWARGLSKTYGTTTAVAGLDLTVHRGEIFGLLGPNGAGKTTTVEMLEGLRLADQGMIRVLGLDPYRDAHRLVYQVGIQLQEAALPGRLKVREIMALFAAFYPHTLSPDELLRRLALHDQADTYFAKLSGGQKQRVFAALALLNDPQVIFVDEITTGLDPGIRRQIWGFLRELRRAGKTILLTTHYLEEAQALCDRVLILDQGRPVAQGHPMELIADLGARFRLEVEVTQPVPPTLWEDLPVVVRGQAENGLLTLYLRDEAGLEEVLAALRRARVSFHNLRLQPVSLEDVFLLLTQPSLS